MKKLVGMIGVGLMGQGIAKNLVKKGCSLAFLDHPGNQPIDELVAAGARVFPDAATVARNADVVILCVTGAPEVESVLTGEKGVLDGIRPGSIVVDCTTSLPGTSVKMAKAVREAGGSFLDAAMTRTPKHAQEGTLNLLVGGDRPVVEEVRPILEMFSERITHVGPVGAGHRMKLLHNYISLGFMALLSEVAGHARRSGFSAADLVDVLEKGGGAGAALQRMTPFLLSGDSTNLAFSLGNALKDLGYYCETASDAGAYHEIADAVRKTLKEAVDGGYADSYFPKLAEFLGKWSA
jgi:3-hydroxyisobutyrate dehydrogenase-like beta-hydroxyacid dehydrogenase